ncbi:hypothetical protein CLV47_11768 [Antricoccus suffuscus]|uniref:Uncharacterized protein n=1 Tax=Antricoccus suffuscus TaxID=1629062 RepID=A0A2T0ZVQ2_9ACTN|nr:hypothetical protein CLV47_11768 [Antricoccus suffuscus]
MLLVFVGIPLLIAAIVWGLLSLGGSGAGGGRYHLGERWTSAPLWFVGSPKQGSVAHPHLIESDSRAREAHEAARVAGSVDTVHGGASGSW